MSPLKIKDDTSMYENGSTLDTGSTSLHARKNRLGHSTLVSMDHNGSPMTTLLRFVIRCRGATGAVRALKSDTI